MRIALLLVDRALPFLLLAGLWALVGPEAPYDGGDVVVIAAIIAGALGGWYAFHEATARPPGGR